MTDEKLKIKAVKGSVAGANFLNSPITVINGSGDEITDEEKQLLESQYLTRVMSDCTALKWLRQFGKEDDKTSAQGLQGVYTALMTQSVQSEHHPLLKQMNLLKPDDFDIAGTWLDSANKKHLSALAMLNQCNKLVLTGDPGSGKSAFVDYLALCMAGEALGNTNANINLLTDPIPDNDGEPLTEEVGVEGSDETEKREVRQPWDHGALIPVRVILRDFSTSVYFPDEKEKADVCQVLDFIESSLKVSGCLDYFLTLQERLLEGAVLVMFDGLDEVPQAGDRRERLLQCIDGFTSSFAKCRVLVTCRPYAYQNKRWRLDDFVETRLAEFGRGQMICFIHRWYANSPELDEDHKKHRADKLQNAILKRENLTELAKRPLLLSLIAYLHANRHGLPERRADLYEQLLVLLVGEWERVRFSADDAQTALEQHQASLSEYLHIGQDSIREVLERLAFRAHASQGPGQQGTADISADDLTKELSRTARKSGKKIDPYEISIFLCDRVGILYQRGGANELDAVYTFPHRSFQEYLAAAYFRRDADAVLDYFEGECSKSNIELDGESWQYLAAYLGKTDPDRWREVVVLLGGMKSLTDADPVWNLLDELNDEGEYSDIQQAWGMRLAAEILADSVGRHNLKRSKLKTFKSIKHNLLHLLGTTNLPARERVVIGNYLSEIGDPRPEVYDVDSIPFCLVPKGEFWMGRVENDCNEPSDAIKGLKESPAGNYDLSYDYWISQYPVSVAQFKAFFGSLMLDLEQSFSLKLSENKPVVAITQAEALLFCDWLTQRWRSSGMLSENWTVTLPNEPEWEKAARGGEQVLTIPIVCNPKDNAFEVLEPTAAMQINDNPLRIYAWGDDLTDEHVNYNGDIGGVSSLGVYPSGVSPYGCHDLNGNIWEWTRSEKSHYPYPNVGTKAWEEQEVKELSGCVLRGGSFYHNHFNMRCSFRGSIRPDFRYQGLGFRIVLSPSL